jgi:hypothetical protein
MADQTQHRLNERQRRVVTPREGFELAIPVSPTFQKENFYWVVGRCWQSMDWMSEGGSRMFSFSRRPHHLWGPHGLLHNGYRRTPPRGKAVDHSPPTSAKIRKIRAYPLLHTSSRRSAYLVKHRDSFAFVSTNNVMQTLIIYVKAIMNVFGGMRAIFNLLSSLRKRLMISPCCLSFIPFPPSNF